MVQERIGIVGGGQLGRMLTEAALPLGLAVTVIDPTEDCPAAQAGASQIQAPLTDPEAVGQLARMTDVITWEIEHIDPASLLNAPAQVEPSPGTLAVIQDKLSQKRMLADAGIPVADFMELGKGTLERDMAIAFAKFGSVMVKTRTGGYDGRGNMVVTPGNWEEAKQRFGSTPLYAEKYEPLQRELSLILARDITGRVVQYPLVETIHHNNICHLVVTPPDIDPQVGADVEEIGYETARHLEGAGVVAIEMFVNDRNEVLVNEIAPRVHNSGHHTIEANRTSQFQQHIRAIAGLPLGSTELITPAAAMINILGERNGPVALQGVEKVLAYPGTYLHVYGKRPTKVERKMGHITVVSGTVDEARRIAVKARGELDI